MLTYFVLEVNFCERSTTPELLVAPLLKQIRRGFESTLSNQKSRHWVDFFDWRRERDSNPRGRLLPPNDLANRPLKPLGYLSLLFGNYNRWLMTKKSLINCGGEGGIRTHGTVSGTLVFKTSSLNHSDTSP